MREASWLAEAARTNPPRPGLPPVRVPGDAAQRRRREAMASGVELYPGIMDGLARTAQRLGVELPAPITA